MVCRVRVPTVAVVFFDHRLREGKALAPLWFVRRIAFWGHDGALCAPGASILFLLLASSTLIGNPDSGTW